MLVSERSILVTGGSGFVGSNVLQKLVEKGKLAVDYDVSPAPPYLSNKIKVIKGDLTDFPRLFSTIKEFNVEGIIHTIAVQPSTGSEEMPMQAIRVNVEGTLNVLEAARLSNLRRVIFCSTTAVYGLNRIFPPDKANLKIDKKQMVKLKEDDPHPIPSGQIYAISKLTGEQLCLYYSERFGVDTVTLRLTNVYGPGQRPFKKPFTAGGQEIDWMVHSAVKDGKIEMERGGDQLKCYTYIKDVVQAMLLAYEKDELKHKVYNVSSGEVVSVKQIVGIIKKLLPNVSVNIGPGAYELVPATDISRARDDLNYEPTNVEKAIPEYIKWLQEDSSRL